MKIITVNECFNCPYVKSNKFTGEIAYCCKIGKSIMNLSLIPDWCPLADVPLTSSPCPKCGETEPVLHCEKCGHNFNS